MILCKTDEEFVDTSVKLLTEKITHAIEQHGRCVLGLSGGRTPRVIYGQLAQAMNIEWSKLHLFLVDERCVPPEDPASTQALLANTLLRYDNIPDENCVFPDTTLEPEACAADYDKRLGELFEKVGVPDLVVLGLGTDGHIGSLFPPVPKEAFGDRRAIHTSTTVHETFDRIAVTIPPLHAAKEQIFFLSHPEKKPVWEEMMSSSEGPERWPAKGVMAFGETTVVAQW